MKKENNESKRNATLNQAMASRKQNNQQQDYTVEFSNDLNENRQRNNKLNLEFGEMNQKNKSNVQNSQVNKNKSSGSIGSQNSNLNNLGYEFGEDAFSTQRNQYANNNSTQKNRNTGSQLNTEFNEEFLRRNRNSRVEFGKEFNNDKKNCRVEFSEECEDCNNKNSNVEFAEEYNNRNKNLNNKAANPYESGYGADGRQKYKNNDL